VIYETEPLFSGVKGVAAEHVSFADLSKITALSTANNCLAVFEMLPRHDVDFSGLVVALDEIRDPGNLGTIIRLCDWFGIKQLVCSKGTADVYNPKVIQATMGSIARVAVSYADLPEFLSTAQVPVFGTFMDGEDIYGMTLPKTGIIVMGNEANGISPEVESLTTRRVSIPRFGDLQQTESLNVATAAAIILSEFKRR
ncbi:MAG: RNA methyltransferase, partial [Chitinophagaceae bacterium]